MVYVLAALPKICFFNARPHLANVEGNNAAFKSAGPVIVVAALILCFVVWSLANLIKELSKRDDGEVLVAAKRWVGLFLFLMVSSGFVLIGQLSSLEVTSASYWSYALWNDG